MNREIKDIDKDEDDEGEWLSEDEKKENGNDNKQTNDNQKVVKEFSIFFQEGTCLFKGCENISATFSQIISNLSGIGMDKDCIYIKCVGAEKHKIVDCENIPNNKRNNKFLGFVFGTKESLYCAYHFNGICKLGQDFEYSESTVNNKKQKTS